MGIKTFWKLLDWHNIGEEGHLSDLEDCCLAVDLSGWIVASQQVSVVNRKIRKPHLRDLFFKCCHLIKHQSRVVFILDGKAPLIKASELERRRAIRQQYSGTLGGPGNEYEVSSTTGLAEQLSPGRSEIFKICTEECCELLTILGLPWIQSKGEAEATCAWLNNTGIVDGVVSQDGDSFLFGANTVYRNFSSDESKVSFKKYLMDDIYHKLGLRREHLVALALLIGCDYDSEGVRGIGKEQAFKMLEKWENGDPLERFENWRDNKKLDKIEKYKSLKKPVHCGYCQHLGSVTSHRKEGCSLCQTDATCLEGNDCTCNCVFHRRKAKYEKHALELKIRREALKDPGFPNKEIISAFLKPEGVECDIPSLSWKPPNLVKLKNFLKKHLGWGDDLFTSRVFPLIVTSALYHNNHDNCLYKMPQPHTVVKKRTKHGHKLYEVIWRNLDPAFSSTGGQITEPVPVKAFTQKFPDLVKEFDERQLEKKSGKKGKRMKSKHDEDTSQTTVDMFFNVRKNATNKWNLKIPKSSKVASIASETSNDQLPESSQVTGKFTLLKRCRPKISLVDSESEDETIERSLSTTKKVKLNS